MVSAPVITPLHKIWCKWRRRAARDEPCRRIVSRQFWPFVALCVLVNFVLIDASPSVEQDDVTSDATEIGSVAFWEEMYSEPPRRGVGDFAFAWQGVGWPAIRDALGSQQVPPVNARWLIIGCGDSSLPEDIFDAGWKAVTAVDWSKSAVTAASARGDVDGSRPGLTWLQEDVSKLSLSDDSFDVVVDVGLLDSLFASVNGTSPSQVLLEVRRVLRSGGLLLSVSTEPPFFRSRLFDENPRRGWVTDVVRLPRPRKLDPRVAELDPEMELGKLTLFVTHSTKGQFLPPLPAEDPTPIATQSFAGVADASETGASSLPEIGPPSTENVPIAESGETPEVPSLMPEAGHTPADTP